MHSKDMVASNIEAIAALFPNCVTERKDANGKVTRGIDFEKLQQELSNDIIERGEERYQFTWPGKMAAIREANTPTNSALRPDVDGSEDFWNTKNLYIEGDNLEVLKLLQEDYLGKVKMIYIDPPYNTGNDFVYNDDFAETSADFSAKAGMFDENGNMLLQRFEKNAESNGRFHTDWLNMMYPRLKVSRNLLKNDGVIFISIDDNEVENLRKICDEIFGSQNFLAQIIWERAFSPINLMKHFSPSHDYILCYAKDINSLECFGIPRSGAANDRYNNPDNDPRGPWTSGDLSVGPAIEANIYPITTPSGKTVMPPSGYSWRVSKDELERRIKDNRIWFGEDGANVPRIKRFLSELKKQGITPMTYWRHEDVGHSQSATQSLLKLFDGNKVFDYPKPVELIKRCIALYSSDDDIILDFFSGSATTAQSLFELNTDDSRNRKFILIQLPEATDEKSVAAKLGYSTICDIAKDRILKAAQKIKEESPLTTQHLDTGFRVLKLADSNMKQVYYTPLDTKTQMEMTLFDTASNIKEDRTDLDLLFQVMLEKDVTLDAPIRKEVIQGHDVYFVDDTYLVAAFGEKLPEELIKELAKMQPFNFVMANRGLSDDSMADNFEQIFKAYSPDTNCMIL